jgi:23S rRNA (uracil1939-C5)-methyltransferase
MVNLVTYDDRPDVMTAYAAMLLSEAPGTTTIVNNVTTRKSQVALGDTEKVYHGPGFITECIGARTYRISANSFFQTNTAQAERLYDVAAGMAALTGVETVYDLYSGTGTIALHLAGAAREIVGIESVQEAVEDARNNASFNRVTNCTFIQGDLKEKLTKDTSWAPRHGRPDVVVTDPPRSGMHPEAVKQLLSLGARRIVYVSCNPATQARDLQILTAPGRYTVTAVQPVDMFPHTYHIENVALLSLS